MNLKFHKSSWWISQVSGSSPTSSANPPGSAGTGQSLVHDRSRSTMNNHPCLANEPSQPGQAEAAFWSLWLHQPIGAFCQALFYTWSSLGLCSHHPCSTHTDIQTTSDTSNSLYTWKTWVFQVLKSVWHHCTAKRVKMRTWWTPYCQKHKFTLGFSAAERKQPCSNLTYCSLWLLSH